MWLTHLVYGLSLLGAIFCLGLIDYKHKYAWFKDRRRTLVTIIPAVVMFVLWDVAGIRLHVFASHSDTYRSGLLLGPNFPVEEIFFLTLLTYTALIIWRSLCERGRHRV